MFRFGSRKANRQEYRCTVRFLDDDEPPIDCDFQHMCLGQYILDFVCSSIGLLEKDLFGLRYVDYHNQRRWLDLSKPVLKQVKGLRNVVFCFRVKYYPPNPLDLKEEACRYQVYLQLKRDLSHGRLNCTQSEAALMVAYVKQAELGDWDTELGAIGGTPSEDGLVDDNNVDMLGADCCDEEMRVAASAEQHQQLLKRAHPSTTFTIGKLLPKHSQEIELRVERIHQTLKGISAIDAQDLFLKRAASLESYGVDPHPVKNEHNEQLYLGVNHTGVLTFRAGKRDLHIRFDDLVKFNYEGKMFILHVMTAGSKRKQVLGFRCPSQAACQHLFSCANDIRCYFTSIPPLVSGRNTLSRAMSILKKRESSLASLHPNAGAGFAGDRVSPSGNIAVGPSGVRYDAAAATSTLTEHDPAEPAGIAGVDEFDYDHQQHQRTLMSLHRHRKDGGGGEATGRTTKTAGRAAADIDSLLHVCSEDELAAGESDAAGCRDRASRGPQSSQGPQSQPQVPLVTPTVDGTPTRQQRRLQSAHHQQQQQQQSFSLETGEPASSRVQPVHFGQNGELRVGPAADASGAVPPASCSIYESAGSPGARTLDGTPLESCSPCSEGRLFYPSLWAVPLARHGQLVALASLVLLLVFTLSTIAVMESDSVLFEEVKAWPPLAVLRREYYHPAKSFFSGRL